VWSTPVIPALGRLRQEGHEFKASLDYLVRPCLKQKQKDITPHAQQASRHLTVQGDLLSLIREEGACGGDGGSLPIPEVFGLSER
jgi:hypothetical protein